MSFLFSVVTPSFNQGRFIERTIQSVQAQDLPEVEYVIYDGGSTDDTLDVLKGYGTNLRWFSGRDGGQADAVNKGFANTSGELLGWLNSDDIFYPGALRTVCEYFDRYPSVDVVYGNANYIDENDTVIEPYPTEAWDLEHLKSACFLCQPATFMRRNVLEKYGYLDPQLQYCMDYEFWLRLGIAGARFAHLHELLAGSRLYPQNKSLGSRAKVHGEINSMTRRLLGEVPESWIYNYAHAVLDARGYSRNDRRRYVIGLSVLALYASLRWNHVIRRGTLKTATRWIASAFGSFG